MTKTRMKRHKSNSIDKLNGSSSSEATGNVQANADATNNAIAEGRLFSSLIIHVIFQVLLIVGGGLSLGSFAGTLFGGWLLAVAELLTMINMIFLIGYGCKGCNAKTEPRLKVVSIIVLVLMMPLALLVAVGGQMLIICTIYESHYW